jgi:hypothetical protein
MFKKNRKTENVKKRRWPKVAALLTTGAAAASAVFVFAQKKNTSK